MSLQALASFQNHSLCLYNPHTQPDILFGERLGDSRLYKNTKGEISIMPKSLLEIAQEQILSPLWNTGVKLVGKISSIYPSFPPRASAEEISSTDFYSTIQKKLEEGRRLVNEGNPDGLECFESALSDYESSLLYPKGSALSNFLRQTAEAHGEFGNIEKAEEFRNKAKESLKDWQDYHNGVVGSASEDCSYLIDFYIMNLEDEHLNLQTREPSSFFTDHLTPSLNACDSIENPHLRLQFYNAYKSAFSLAEKYFAMEDYASARFRYREALEIQKLIEGEDIGLCRYKMEECTAKLRA